MIGRLRFAIITARWIVLRCVESGERSIKLSKMKNQKPESQNVIVGSREAMVKQEGYRKYIPIGDLPVAKQIGYGNSTYSECCGQTKVMGDNIAIGTQQMYDTSQPKTIIIEHVDYGKKLDEIYALVLGFDMVSCIVFAFIISHIINSNKSKP